MKKAMNQCLMAGLAVTCAMMMGCAKREASPVDATEKKVEAAQPAADDSVVCPIEPVKPAENAETAIPKDHPAH